MQEAEAHHSKALSLKILSCGARDATNAYTLSELGSLYEQKRDKDTVCSSLSFVVFICPYAASL